MSLRICSLASGSSGNCYVIQTEDTALLVDAGISGKQIKERLETINLSLDDIAAVLITHEHSDHIKGLSALIKLNRRLYAREKTLASMNLDMGEISYQTIEKNESFLIGNIEITAFSTSHDAVDPVGFYLSSEEKSICIVTDTGFVSEEIKNYMSQADIIVLESNHDENVLKMGPYPWFLKQRILSDKGHLSNEAAAKALAEIIVQEESKRKRLVLLAHLSKENNFPEMAQATMENILIEAGCKANACVLKVLSRNEVSDIYE